MATTSLHKGTPRFAESVECGSMHDAEQIRRQFSDCLHEEDDARRREILISASVPKGVKNEIGQIAAESWERDRFGSDELTEFERDQLDFTETNVMHAQAVKALAIGLGVDDWMAYYDTTLSTDEHRDRLRQVSGDDMTMRDIPMVVDQGGKR